jgi:hypothetical protein
MLIVIPIKLNRHKQLATGIMLKTPAISCLGLQGNVRSVVSVDYNCKFFLDSLDIVAPSPIGTFLKLVHSIRETKQLKVGQDKDLHLKEIR